MEYLTSKKFWSAAIVRSVKTFAQTLAAEIGISGAVGFGEIGWMRAVSVAGVAALLSIITSLAGLPEASEPEKEK